MEETENWGERLQQFKKEQIIKSEPEDYIHVGLDSSAQYSTLEHFIRTELESAHREGYELGLKAERERTMNEIIEYMIQEIPHDITWALTVKIREKFSNLNQLKSE